MNPTAAYSLAEAAAFTRRSFGFKLGANQQHLPQNPAQLSHDPFGAS
jgi:hypothetical protein